jgi:hypothetical protein
MILAYRLAPAQWNTDEQFERMLGLLTSYRQAVDEIALFDYPHSGSVAPLEGLERAAEIMRQRMVTLREVGFPSVGINVLATLGHGDVPGEWAPRLPYQPLVGHDGQVSRSCACPNDPDFLGYVRERFALTARAGPDFIWVDDDLRLTHHGPTYPCFCPLCLEAFGHESDREALVARLNDPQGGALRRAWTEFCAASVERLCAGIREAVEGVDPGIELGLMTIGYSHSTYAGYPVGRWMRALGARRGRPGHGYYTDHVRSELLNKALDVGRQIRDYPPVETIQYELENYPHIGLDKATRTVLNECSAALAMGCNGIAYAAFGGQPGSLAEYEPLLAGIAADRPIWEALVEGAAGMPPVGLWPADSPMLQAHREVDESGWFWEGGLYDVHMPNQLFEMGIPLTPDPQAACGIVLAGKMAEAFSTEELREMLSQGVLMDAAALGVLWARGLGEWAGVKLGDAIPPAVSERFTDHELNGLYAGSGRYATMATVGGIYSLVPIAEGVGDLSHLVAYGNTDCGSCFTTYANPLGGRVAVSSYAPWRQLGRGGKRFQLLAVADWLSGGRLPARIDETVRVAPFVRASADGRRLVVVLLNTALDPTGPLTLRLDAQVEGVSLISAAGEVPLSVHAGEHEVSVAVPSIPAWQTSVLIGR